MSKIIILTDSCCDLPKETIDELGIKVIPFTLTVGGESFREIYDKSTQEFYELLETTDEIPKHSQISPVTFEATYKELFEQGYTDIISVSINSKGSGTYNNSIIGKEDFFENNPSARGKLRIFNLDSKCYTLFYGYPVMEAAKKIRRGADAEEIVAYLEDWFNVCSIYAVPYNLKYAKKSGRIPAAAAFVGEIMGLRPVSRIQHNQITTEAKVRGDKALIPKIIELTAGEQIPKTPYCVVYGNDTEVRDEMIQAMTKKLGYPPADTYQIGSEIAVNAGPKVIGVILKSQKK